jgi:hypothetical protein
VVTFADDGGELGKAYLESANVRFREVLTTRHPKAKTGAVAMSAERG